MQKGFDSYRCHMPKAKKKALPGGSSARVLSVDPRNCWPVQKALSATFFTSVGVEVYNGATCMACDVQHTPKYSNRHMYVHICALRFPYLSANVEI